MSSKHATRAMRLGRRAAIPQELPGREGGPNSNAVVECGWGRLIAGHTFKEPARIAAALLDERPGQRDIAFYVERPHVVVAQAPQQLFIDPSEAFRLWLSEYRPSRATRKGFTVRRLRTRADVAAVNTLYRSRRMVPVDPMRVWGQRAERQVIYALAEDRASGEVIGVAMGIDHAEAFGDSQPGASLWALAVTPQASHPGVGEALTRYLAEHFQARGRAYMDVSVLHDNASAIALYEKLGFQHIQVFAVKRRNAINEPLFTGPQTDADAHLNPYARIIVDEARRRGIYVEVLDAENGYFRLSLGGRGVVCRESLSELTSAIAMSRCADKRVTLRLLDEAGLKVPAQTAAGEPEHNAEFLKRHGAIVVKPVEGEQGKGISVHLTSADDVEAAIAGASQYCDRVLLEQYCAGEDLRILVIDHQVVAAAIRRPPVITGDGVSTVTELIEKQSRRRAAATGGESRIPLDAETLRCVAARGHRMDEVLPSGTQVTVRNTANLHTGGTIHDVTDTLHPVLRSAAQRASRALDIPVTGLDFLVPAVDGPDYVIIEANERPGHANHEPQPTAERFVDMLFPRTRIEETTE